jgi:hypothetical protein
MNDALTFIGVWYIIGLSVVSYMLFNGVIIITRNGQVASGFRAFALGLVFSAIIASVWPYAVFKLMLARMPR